MMTDTYLEPVIKGLNLLKSVVRKTCETELRKPICLQ